MAEAFQPGVDKARCSKAGVFIADAYEAFLTSHVRHTDNEFFGVPFKLDPFQRDMFWRPVFGQGRYVGKGEARRFRRKINTVVFGLPRNSGKSDLACGTLLTIATMEPTHAGEYAIIAGTKVQASKDMGKLKSMIRQDPDLRALWEIRKDEIVNRDTDARIMVMPYSEEALQSWHLNVCILDEAHIYRDSALYDAVVSGNGKIFGALTIIITTAAKSRSGFLWDKLPEWREDPAVHVAWLGARDDEDVDDERMWRRTHPMSWCGLDYMRDQRRKLSRASFERYEVNRFPLEKSADRSMRMSDIRACQRVANGFDFSKRFCLAIDGATSGDAFAIVAHQIADGVDCWHEWVYDDPGEAGYYPLGQIEQLVAELHQRYRCPVGIDQARLLLMAQHLQDDYGVEIYEVPQSNKVMCPACSLVVQTVRSHSCALEGCPKLADHLSNCRDLEREPFGKRFACERHGRGTERIDAAVAAAMAKWMTATMPETLSFAETGGVWSV